MKISKQKIKLIIGCALQFFMNSELWAEFELDDFDLTLHRAHYNSLPSVEDSGAKLQSSPQFQSLLKEAGEIVSRYELNDLMGLRLIHRHFALSDKQVMSEKYEIVDSIPSFVTQARSLDEAKEIKAIPSSWIFSTSPEKEVLLFEASSDPAVVRAKSALEKSPEFFEEISKTLDEYNLNHLLSLAVLKRDSLVAQEGQVYMEVNSANDNRSVVQLRGKNHPSISSIRTSWSFKGPHQLRCLEDWYCKADHDDRHWLITDHYMEDK